MKTHFSYVFSQVKRFISDICAFVVFQNLKDVTEAAQLAAQLKTNGMSF